MPAQSALNITEAIKAVKEKSKEKFDPSIEAHFRLGLDPKKGEQQVRGSVLLPHGSGKSVRVAAFAEGEELKKAQEAGADLAGGEDLIAQIKQSGKTDFAVAVAQPQLMARLSQIAKILGPKGLMPSPKDDTVTPQVAKTVKELKMGRISFKNDDTGNLHMVFGKKSFGAEQLAENFQVLLETVKKMRPTSLKGEYIKAVYINSSMGASVRVLV